MAGRFVLRLRDYFRYRQYLQENLPFPYSFPDQDRWYKTISKPCSGEWSCFRSKLSNNDYSTFRNCGAGDIQECPSGDHCCREAYKQFTSCKLRRIQNRTLSATTSREWINVNYITESSWQTIPGNILHRFIWLCWQYGKIADILGIKDYLTHHQYWCSHLQMRFHGSKDDPQRFLDRVVAGWDRIPDTFILMVSIALKILDKRTV